MFSKSLFRHPLFVAFASAFLSLIVLFGSNAIDSWFFRNSPKAIISYADWDLPISIDEATKPDIDFKINLLKQNRTMDYATIIVSNEGNDEIVDVTISFDFELDFVIFTDDTDSLIFENSRNVPEFDLNPDQFVTIKVIDSIHIESGIQKILTSHSSRGELDVRYEMGIRPFSVFHPQFALAFFLIYSVFITISLFVLDKANNRKQSLETGLKRAG